MRSRGIFVNHRFIILKIETKNITLIDQKSRMLQIQGVKGKAVVIYCEPLTTLKMGHHRLSRRVNKIEIN